MTRTAAIIEITVCLTFLTAIAAAACNVLP